ncbi:hypothetical protein AMATHDRAFT_152998 [Amanita thiersii Skay4041]|uniref:Uncharacterized protein n=1 Tax=Amanita thiersii Skay4041 TaxID=703135 RepID=A0A2A9NHE8_9AGAR|nr:hypothetical protein AMATHDRAFT_152998 [Amanita thiersii Skay4041]
MPCTSLHDQLLCTYFLHLCLGEQILPTSNLTADEILIQVQADLELFQKIKTTRYLNPCTSIPKAGNLHLAWVYAESPEHHHLFLQMLHVLPGVVFSILLDLIKNHMVFFNNSNTPQMPVDYQLAVTLYKMGWYGNAASLANVACNAGCSEGSVKAFTDHCLHAICYTLQPSALKVQPLSAPIPM